MPVICDPKSDYKIILESDKDKESPPAFIYRVLNTREWKKVGQVYDDINNGKTKGIVEHLDIIMDAVSTGLIGWENIFDREGNAVPFCVENLDLWVTPMEASQDLMQKILSSGTLSNDDKKKSELQTASGTA